MRRKVIVILIVTALAGLTVLVAHWSSRSSVPVTVAGQYRIHWMPVGVAPYSSGQYGLNATGDVAVDVFVDDEIWCASRAARWSIRSGKTEQLETGPRLLSRLTDRYSAATAINAKGHVVGTLFRAVETSIPFGDRNVQAWGQVAVRGFLWTPEDGLVELPAFTPRDIDDHGRVVGYHASPSLRVHRAVLWEAEAGLRELEALTDGGESFAIAINETGWIAGNSLASDGKRYPALWKAPDELLDLGVPEGFTEGFAVALNDHGDVLTEFETEAGGSEDSEYFLWIAEREDYERVTLPPGYEQIVAHALTNERLVLVAAYPGDLKPWKYFLVSEGGHVELPPVSATDETRYCSLNENGWLAGFTVLQDSPEGSILRRGFVAVPLP